MGYAVPRESGALSNNALDDLPNDGCHDQVADTDSQSILAGRISPRQWKELNQLVMKLPSPAETQELLNVFFSEANWYFTVLDQYYFGKAHRIWLRSWDFVAAATEQQISANTLFFPALLFQVLALGVQFVPSGSGAEKAAMSLGHSSLDQLSQHFSETGQKFSKTMGHHIQAITSIEADLMRCAWLKNSGRGAEAWFSLGNAVRQAQDQKLHLEPEARQMSDVAEQLRQAWYNEHKRRLWACLFTWESHMALQLGRARMINASDCTVRPPIDSDMPDNPSRTMFVATGTDERPSHYTSACVKYTLAQHIHKIISLGALHPQFSSYSVIQSIHAEVTWLLSGLPPAVRAEKPDTSWDLQYPEMAKHRLQISIIANAFLLSLHRPHAVRHSESLKLAISAAIQVLDASQLLFEMIERNQHKTYTLVFYTIDAGIILSAMVGKRMHEADGTDYDALRALRQAVNRLSTLKERNPAAIAGERVLMQCLAVFGHKIDKRQAETEHLVIQLQPQVVDQGRQSQPPGSYSAVPNAQDAEFAYTPLSEAMTRVLPGDTTDQASSSWNQFQRMIDDQDFFAEIMNDSAYTATWLENVNNLSFMDVGYQDDFFGTGLV